MSASTGHGGEAAHVGRPLKRREDPRFVTGRATYVDDLNMPGLLHAAIVRSPEAHARIVSVDAGAARARDDVVLVLTGHDMDDVQAPLSTAVAPRGTEIANPPRWPLARAEVNHVGEPVALVVGTDRYCVVDAAEQVAVDYEPLPAVVDPRAALTEDAALVHADLGTNRAFELSLGGGDVEAGLAEADVVVERELIAHRTSAAPIEPRGVVADYRAGWLTVHSSTQAPHLLRRSLALVLGIGEERIRCVAPAVGGGFGAKLAVYGEEVLLAYASRRVQRPVKWIESRSEHLQASHHGRDQRATCRMGARSDGTVTAFHVAITADLGAYPAPLTPVIPALGASLMSGCYAIASVRTDITGAFTNKMATDAIRGAGRAEAIHMVEVMMDQVAAELRMSPPAIRRRNFIPSESFPAAVATGVVYDSGDYHATLDKLLAKLDVEGFRREQARLRERGIYRGIGLSTYTDIGGSAPPRLGDPDDGALAASTWEPATVRVHPSGAVTVYAGSSPHGQGHETALAQIAADRLGVDPVHVEVVHGDTQSAPPALGTYGPPSLIVGGEAVAHASASVADKARAIVAHRLAVAPADVEVSGGRFSVRDAPDRGMALAEVARAAYGPEDLPEGMEPGLEETSVRQSEGLVFPFGAHVAIVDVDAATGSVRVARYIAVDDCGRAVNPRLVDGQVHGGVVHGIGQVLYERVHYDGDGQLVTGSLADYPLPGAAEVPAFDTDRTETPSPVSSLGVKGIAEVGPVAAPAAVTNAVIDALRPLGVAYLTMPLTPMRVWEAIQEARGGLPA